MTKKIPGISLLTFFKRRLACCLAKSLAHVINVRGNRMLSHVVLRYDRIFDPRNQSINQSINLKLHNYFEKLNRYAFK